MPIDEASSHTFVGAFKDAMQRYASFAGRSSRAQYWWMYLWYLIILVLGTAIETIVFGGMTGGLLTTLAVLALFIPMLALSVRRLHDTDRSGWWVLITFVPIIGFLIFLYFAVLAGTDGSNRFGEKP